MITLYGAFRSRALRPLWALEEAGLPYVHVPVLQSWRLADPAAADAPLNTRSPAFLAINPMGGIPAMTDGDLTLTESLAITLHVGRRAGGELGPRDAAEDIRMVNWALLAATGIEEHALAIMRAQAAGTPEAPQAETARAALVRPLGVLEAQLSATGHVLGHRFTVADIMLAEVVRYATAQPGFLDPWPATKAWLAACHARPAFAALWARREAEPA
jgi:glutathione S-transferase